MVASGHADTMLCNERSQGSGTTLNGHGGGKLELVQDFNGTIFFKIFWAQALSSYWRQTMPNELVRNEKFSALVYSSCSNFFTWIAHPYSRWCSDGIVQWQHLI